SQISRTISPMLRFSNVSPTCTNTCDVNISTSTPTNGSRSKMTPYAKSKWNTSPESASYLHLYTHQHRPFLLVSGFSHHGCRVAGRRVDVLHHGNTAAAGFRTGITLAFFGVADKFGNAVNAKASKCNTADHRQRGTQRGQNAATNHSSTSSSRTSSCCSTSSRRSTCTSRSAADTQNTAQTRNHARSRAQGLQRSTQCLQSVNQIDHRINHANGSRDATTNPRDVRPNIRNRLVPDHIAKLGCGRTQ